MSYSKSKTLAIDVRAGAVRFEKSGRESLAGRPNGLAQAQRRANGTPLLLSRNSAKGLAYHQRQSRCRLEPVLGARNWMWHANYPLHKQQ
jgi:hypothetical protein